MRRVGRFAEVIEAPQEEQVVVEAKLVMPQAVHLWLFMAAGHLTRWRRVVSKGGRAGAR